MLIIWHHKYEYHELDLAQAQLPHGLFGHFPRVFPQNQVDRIFLLLYSAAYQLPVLAAAANDTSYTCFQTNTKTQLKNRTNPVIRTNQNKYWVVFVIVVFTPLSAHRLFFRNINPTSHRLSHLNCIFFLSQVWSGLVQIPKLNMAYPNRSQIDAAARDAQHQLDQIRAQAEQNLAHQSQSHSHFQYQPPAPNTSTSTTTAAANITAPNMDVCPGRDTVSGAHWYGWPECLICVSCFHTFARSGSLAHPQTMPMWNTRVDQDCCCDMYSPRQRGRYISACQNPGNDTTALLEASRVRAQVWEETMLGLARLDSQREAAEADVYMARAMANINAISAQNNAMIDSYSGLDVSFGSSDTRDGWRTDTGNVYHSWNGVVAEREQLEADEYARIAAEAEGEGEEAKRERERLEARWKEFE